MMPSPMTAYMNAVIAAAGAAKDLMTAVAELPEQAADFLGDDARSASAEARRLLETLTGDLPDESKAYDAAGRLMDAAGCLRYVILTKGIGADELLARTERADDAAAVLQDSALDAMSAQR